jgi:hypothetical protein
MMRNARLPVLFRRAGGGRRSLDKHSMAVNLSFVLHESSSSVTVRHAARASHRHASRRARRGDTVVDGPPSIEIDTWLAPSVGFPEELPAALDGAGYADRRIYFIDGGAGEKREAMFFRSRANLTLPGHNIRQVGVAAFIERPGGGSRQLIVRGPFPWAIDGADALRAVETIIQAHVEQWIPGAQLWPVPAEVSLAGEII